MQDIKRLIKLLNVLNTIDIDILIFYIFYYSNLFYINRNQIIAKYT